MKLKLSIIIFLWLNSLLVFSEDGQISADELAKAQKAIKFGYSKIENSEMYSLDVYIPVIENHKPKMCVFSIKEWDDPEFDSEMPPRKSGNQWVCGMGIEIKETFTLIVKIKYENLSSFITGEFKS